jgi:hypothetical protein
MPNNSHEKLHCWNSLLGLQNLSTNTCLIIAGDSNITLHHKEKRAGNLVQYPSRYNLEDLISSLDLLDIKPKRNKYTWTNRRPGKGHIASKVYHCDGWPSKGSSLKSKVVVRKGGKGELGKFVEMRTQRVQLV